MTQGVSRVALGTESARVRTSAVDSGGGCGSCRSRLTVRPAAWTTGEGDYLNCPMTEDEYARFYDALVAAESATVHDFDKEKFFEGCLPIEVMAHRGRDTLRFGPMKPVGLVDPRTGRTPYAVVQLRQDNIAGDHFSLVGFQTQLKWGEQARVLALIPGLEHAEFVRFGMVHRNTYINGPTVLRETWQTTAAPRSVLRRTDLRRRGLRRVGGVRPDRRPQRRGARRAARSRACRRGRRRSARWPTTSRTPIRGTISRRTSRSASCRRPMPPAGRAAALKRDERKTATSERALRALDELDASLGQLLRVTRRSFARSSNTSG